MNFKLSHFYKTTFWISLIGLVAIISNFGFSHDYTTQLYLDNFYFFVLGIGITATLIRYLEDKTLFKRKIVIFDYLSVAYTLWLFYMFLFNNVFFDTDLLLKNPILIKLAVLFTFIREFSELKINFNRTVLNPAQLFILSFLAIIFIGAFLLILPNATYYEISFIDALFTSTSAVCVTGLAVVDTGKHFTLFGQTIILILIQAGGLGILTFASYFSYLFKGGSSYENHLALRDMTSSNHIGEVFSTLKYIILITFGIELFAAFLIYTSLDSSIFASQSAQIFFSTFHAVSAFCNAGFSTLSNSLYETNFRFNYYLQSIIIFTFVLGGLGFPIVVNILKYFKYRVVSSFSSKNKIHKPWLLNLNSRITLVTTVSISLVAFVIFYILEYNNTLAEHNGLGKIVTALFGATTPRTAGFNSIDTAALASPTLFMVLLLMWIGASPQSTGGGIKTSTFAIALLNILSLANGKSRIEIFKREIAEISVQRAFAIISLSLIIIGFAIMLISFFNPEKELMAITFESISAYSTAGLSLGITSNLTDASKFVLIVVMFVGRISMLSLVIAVFKKAKFTNYSYPKEEITIN